MEDKKEIKFDTIYYYFKTLIPLLKSSNIIILNIYILIKGLLFLKKITFTFYYYIKSFELFIIQGLIL